MAEDPSREAVEWLIRVLAAVIPLAAAAQLERLRLLGWTTDLLGDMIYCLSSIPGAQAAAEPWCSLVYALFSK